MKRVLPLLLLVALALPQRADAASSYAFQATYGGRPVHWNACRIIHWSFNPSGAPSGALPVIVRSVRLVSALTGTTWVYDGTSAAAPTSAWLPSTATRKGVLIGWTSLGSATHLGETQSQRVDGTYLAAVVALNRNAHLALTGGGSWHMTLLHELGHVMGLAHSGSSSQLMYALLNKKLTTYQLGDRIGLHALGRAAGC